MYIPGLRVHSRHSGRQRRGKGGRRRYVEDRALLIASVDRLIATGKNASEACKTLARMKTLPESERENPFRGAATKSLANMYYKYSGSVRSLVGYFSLFPESFCDRSAYGACFTAGDFDECDVGDLASLCKSGGDCPFVDQAEAHLSRFALAPPVHDLLSTIADRVESNRQAMARARDGKTRAIKAVRKRATSIKK